MVERYKGKKGAAAKSAPSRQARLDPVTKYAKKVVRGDIVAGPWVRLACQRHLDDLVTAKERGLVWDVSKALRVINYFRDVLILPEGSDGVQPFVLSPYQEFVAGSLFGWCTLEGYRRFRVAYIEIGKGAGKTPFAAGLGLYMTHADGEMGAQVYVAATTRDQANLCFQDAVKMYWASPALQAHLRKSGNQDIYNFTHLRSGSYFRPVSSEGKSLDGKRVHCAIIDELHEHPDNTVVSKMIAGLKGRKQPLIFEITNSGFDKNSICYQHHDMSLRVLRGEVTNDSWFAYVCALDEGDDYRDESVWLKANPNLGVSLPWAYLREQVKIAQAMPAEESLVRRLNFCEWTGVASTAIGKELWDACESDDVVEDAYIGKPCVAGLDLSKRTDLTALSLAFPVPSEREDGQEELHVLTYFWTPEDTMVERSKRDRAHYDVWAEQGYLIPVPGPSINFHWVATKMQELADKFDIKRIVVDPHRMDDLVDAFSEVGLDLVLEKHEQGFKGGQMTRSIDAFFDRLYNRTVKVAINPVMRMGAASVVIITDPQENRKFDKKKSNNRIDGIVAATMAIGAYDNPTTNKPSVFELLAESGEGDDLIVSVPKTNAPDLPSMYAPAQPINQVHLVVSDSVLSEIYRTDVYVTMSSYYEAESDDV